MMNTETPGQDDVISVPDLLAALDGGDPRRADPAVALVGGGSGPYSEKYREVVLIYRLSRITLCGSTTASVYSARLRLDMNGVDKSSRS